MAAYLCVSEAFSPASPHWLAQANAFVVQQWPSKTVPKTIGGGNVIVTRVRRRFSALCRKNFDLLLDPFTVAPSTTVQNSDDFDIVDPLLAIRRIESEKGAQCLCVPIDLCRGFVMDHRNPRIREDLIFCMPLSGHSRAQASQTGWVSRASEARSQSQSFCVFPWRMTVKHLASERWSKAIQHQNQYHPIKIKLNGPETFPAL